MENNFDMFNTPNNFKYSAIEMDSLQLQGTDVYTLVNTLVDESGSVYDFKTQLEECLKTVNESCKKHPRSQNLLMRTASFSSAQGIREMHGFTTVDSVDQSTLVLTPDGCTPLHDATLDSVETMESYAKTLSAQDYFCNGILFVITDGDENASRIATMAKIKNAVANVRKNESLESIKMILIGVNDTDYALKAKLENFKIEAGFDEYISLGDVSASKLAKLAQWISQSISSTSQALGNKGPSQSVNFTI